MFNAVNRHSGTNPITSISPDRPTEGIEMPESVYDDLQSTGYARPLSTVMPNYNPEPSAVESMPPSPGHGILRSEHNTYENADLMFETPYSRLDASTVEPPRPPDVYDRLIGRPYREQVQSPDSANDEDDDYDDAGGNGDGGISGGNGGDHE